MPAKLIPDGIQTSLSKQLSLFAQKNRIFFTKEETKATFDRRSSQ